jgi:multiple sugar transport system permease protein
MSLITAAPTRTPGATSHKTAGAEGRPGGRKRGRQGSAAYGLFLLPGVILVLGLIVYPIWSGVALSFTQANTFTGDGPFVGFENYASFFELPFWQQLLGNSFIRAIGGAVPSYLLGMLAALALQQRLRYAGAARLIVLLPFVISAPVGIYMWQAVFNPYTGVPAGLGLDIGSLFTNTELVWPTLLFMNAWGSFQFYTILLLAGIQRIPTELYEAASIDGAGAIRSFFTVTFPSIRGISAAALAMHFMGSFQDFSLVYIATGGGPLNTTQTLASYAYQSTFSTGFNLGLGSAIAVLSVLLMVVTMLVLVGIFFAGRALLARSAEQRMLRAQREFAAIGRAPLGMLPPRPPTRPHSDRGWRIARRVWSHVSVLLFVLFALFPILFLLSQAFDGAPPGPGVLRFWPEQFTLDNFVSVFSNPAFWRGEEGASAPLILNLANSAIVTIGVTIVVLALASFGGYALSRWKNAATRIWTSVLVVTQLVPAIILLFPLYLLLADLQLLNTRHGLILITATASLPVATLFFRVYFERSPRELEEAAMLDGAGPIRTFVSIVLPNARTALGAMGAFTLIGTWNEFVFALTFVSDPNVRTFPPQLKQFTATSAFLNETSPGEQAVFLLLPIVTSAILLALTIRHFTAAYEGGGLKE